MLEKVSKNISKEKISSIVDEADKIMDQEETKVKPLMERKEFK